MNRCLKFASVLLMTPVFLAAPGAAQSYEEIVKADGPVHYWRFEESSIDDAATDEQGNRDGTYEGGVTLGETSSNPALGNAARFDGANGTHVALGDPLHPGDSVTIEAWVNLDPDVTTAFAPVMARWGGSYELDFNQSQEYRGNMVVQGNGVVVPRSEQPLQLGRWHHVVGIFHGEADGGGGTATIFLDGVQGEEVVDGGNLADGGGDDGLWYIGRTRGPESGFAWQGLLDEVAVYDRALTEEEILAHYELGKPEDEPDPDPVVEPVLIGGTFIEGATNLALADNGAVASSPDPPIAEPFGPENAIDGVYGLDTESSKAWISAEGNSSILVDLAGESSSVALVGWSSDNTGAIGGRVTGRYTVQATNDAAISPDSTWETLFIVNVIADTPERLRRHIYAVPDGAVDATGIRILTESSGGQIAIDEIEVYPAGTEPRVLLAGGRAGVTNLALAADGATASSPDAAIADPFVPENAIDGLYGLDTEESKAWISALGDSSIIIDLAGESHSIDRVAWGSDNTAAINNRVIGTYTLQFTADAAVSSDSSWVTLGQTTFSTNTPDDLVQHVYRFDPVDATGIRILTQSNGAQVAIDEIEVYPPDPPGTSAYADLIRGSDPVHYWRFEEDSAADEAVDEMGGRNGVYEGGIELGQTGAFLDSGNAVRLDGANGTHIALGEPLHPGNSISIEAWVNLDEDNTTAFAPVMARWDGSYELDFNQSQGYQGNMVVRNDINDIAIPTSAQLPLGEWHHVVGIFSGESDGGGGTATIYLDGVQGEVIELGGDLQDLGGDDGLWYIGRTRGPDSGFGWDGFLDEVAVYDRALTLEEINLRLVAGGLPAVEPPDPPAGPGPLVVVDIGGQMDRLNNLALAENGAVAVSPDPSIDEPFGPENVIDGVYGLDTDESKAWISANANSSIFVGLQGSHTIDRVAWGSDNTGAINGRVLGTYTVAYSNDDNLMIDGNWTDIDSVTFTTNETEDLRRHVYQFGPVEATGIRITTQSAEAEIAIDEIEVYAPTPPLRAIPFVGGTFPEGETNLALAANGATALSPDPNIADPFGPENVIDGIYGLDNEESKAWISANANSSIIVDLAGESSSIWAVAWGSDNTGTIDNRVLGTYTLDFTNDAIVDANSNWSTIGRMTFETNTMEDLLRHIYRFDPIEATGIRIVTESNGAQIAIDEIEVFPTGTSLIPPGDSPYANAVIGDGPVHYWRFEESGVDEGAIDQLGNQNGEYAGGIELLQPSVSSRLGTAMRLDGENGTHVDLGEDGPMVENSITVEAWVSLDDDVTAAFSPIVARWDGSFELDVNMPDGGFVDLVIRNTDNAFIDPASEEPLELGVWHHIVGIFDGESDGGGGIGRVYVDGVMGMEFEGGGDLQDQGGDDGLWYIGRTRTPDSGFGWKGLIDEVAIYDYALSEEQILNHFNLALGGAGGTPGFKITRIDRNSDGQVTVTWTSNPGRTYRVETSPGLQAPWADIVDSLEASDGTETSFTDTGVGPGVRELYYRVVEED